MSTGVEPTITLTKDGDWWIARDTETGVTSQGNTRETALSNLDEAVALHKGEIGEEPTDEELLAAGIDPADNTTGNEDPPDVLE